MQHIAQCSIADRDTLVLFWFADAFNILVVERFWAAQVITYRTWREMTFGRRRTIELRQMLHHAWSLDDRLFGCNGRLELVVDRDMVDGEMILPQELVVVA